MASNFINYRDPAKEKKRKILLSGFPGEATNVKASEADCEDQLILSWGPPVGMEKEDLTYSVWIPQYETSSNLEPEKKPSHVRVYFGDNTEFTVDKEMLAAAYAKLKAGKSVTVFTVAAHNQKGHGPVAKLVWKPELDELSANKKALLSNLSRASNTISSKGSAQTDINKSVENMAEKIKTFLVFTNEIPSGFHVNPIMGGATFSWTPPTSKTLEVFGYFVLMSVRPEQQYSPPGDTCSDLPHQLVYNGQSTFVTLSNEVLFNAHVEVCRWPALNFRVGTYDSTGFPGPTADFRWMKDMVPNKGNPRSMAKYVLLKNTFRKYGGSSPFPFPRDFDYW